MKKPAPEATLNFFLCIVGTGIALILWTFHCQFSEAIAIERARDANAGETVRRYDSQQNITGYTIIENGKESHFGRNWNRTGKTDERGIIFDADQNRTGRIKWNGNTGYIFDKAGNQTGYIKKQDGKETFYDKKWRREGYRK